jgi:hypothetical protein
MAMNLLIKKLIDESIQLINTFEKNESLIKILTEDFKLLLEKKDYSIDKEILDLSKNCQEKSIFCKNLRITSIGAYGQK